MTGVWLPLADEATSAAVSDLHAVEIVDDALFWTGPRGGPLAVWDAVMEWTWIVYMVAGGDLWITYYDHVAGDIATPSLVAAFPFDGADFHHVPAVMLRSDGRIHIVWGGHETDANRHYRMTNPRDPSSWIAQTLGVGTYTYGVVSDDDELLVTYRAGETHGSVFPCHEFAALIRCTDGSTWTTSAPIDTTGTPETHSDFYQRDILWRDGRMHVLWSVARGTVHDDTWINLYYAAFDPDTGNWFAVDGTNLGAVINWAEHATCLAVTLTANGIAASLAWFHGAPAINHGPEAGGDLAVTHWDGAAWVTSDPIVSPTDGHQKVLAATPDELLLITHSNDASFFDRDVEAYRLIDDEWEYAGLILRAHDDGTAYNQIAPIHDGPALAMVCRHGTLTGSYDDTAVGPLMLITRRHQATGADADHTHDYAATGHSHDYAGELLMQDGVTSPPVPLETEDGTDWLYEDV